jgi:chitinase
MIDSRLTHTLKPGLAALGFGLTLLTTPSYGQALSMGPPHNVIYWEGTNSILGSLTSPCLPTSGGTGCYTDVILSSVYPDSGCNLQWGLAAASQAELSSDVQQLHAAGKTVLISFGGGMSNNLQSGNYKACSSNISSLVSQLQQYVSTYNFDGVDVDFEDTNSFTSGAQAYDGVSFLNSLTSALYSALTSLGAGNSGLPRNIITHAPQTPYWQNNSQCSWCNWAYDHAPYDLVYWTVGAAAGASNNISWFNNQFYNNGCSNDNGNTNAPSTCASEYFNQYQQILNSVGTTTMPSIMLVIGLPVSTNADTDGGWLNSSDVTWLISQLQQTYPNQFGGVMGWSAEHDASDNGYTWSNEVWTNLKTHQAAWTPQNSQTGMCLDTASSTAGSVYPYTCNGGGSQNWQFSANYILDYQTQWCLDSKNGTVYTLQCNPQYLSQNWQFFGNTIRDRGTGQCLDSNSNSVYTDQCGSPPAAPQSWQ